MERVTIQDVLDAGGEIFGLPCKMREHKAGYCFTNSKEADRNGDFLHVYESRGCLWDSDTISLREFPLFEVYADGIRILDIDGRLWRVTGHSKGAYKTAQLELLIPAPPKPKYCDQCGAELKD